MNLIDLVRFEEYVKQSFIEECSKASECMTCPLWSGISCCACVMNRYIASELEKKGETQ